MGESVGESVGESLEVRVPDIGDFEDVEVIELLVSEGDEIEAESSLLTLESDKATMEIPAPRAGRVEELRVAVGDKVSEGDVLLRLAVEAVEQAPADDGPAGSAGERQEPPGEAEAVEQPPSPPAARRGEESGSEPGSSPGSRAEPASAAAPDGTAAVAAPREHGVPHASPLVRGYARELGLDLTGSEGTGRHGRIRLDDVKAQVRARLGAGGGGADAHHLEAVDLTAVEGFLERFGDRLAPQPPLLAFVLLAALVADLRAGREAGRVSVLAPGEDGRLEARVLDGSRGRRLAEVARWLAEAPAAAAETGGDGLALLDLSQGSGEARPSAAALGFERVLAIGAQRVDPRWTPAEPDGGSFRPRPVLPLCLAYDPTRIDAGEAARFMADVSDGLDRLAPLLL